MKGFNAGKNQVINDLLLSLQSQGKPAIALRQAGGKYCTFDCFKCKAKDQNYKMSSNVGHCDNCNTAYYNFEEIYRLTPDEGMMFDDFIGTVETEAYS